jgi:hypothetical protein
MENIFIKASVIGLSYKRFKEDENLFSSFLLCTFETWIREHFEFNGMFKNDNLSPDIKCDFGLIKRDYLALESDIHNLAINYCMINHILNDTTINSGIKEIYISNLTENYFINLRSAYNYASSASRILLGDSTRDLLPSSVKDSINNMIKFCRNNTKSKQIFSSKINEIFLKIENDLSDIRTIRDSIVHHGNEPIIHLEDSQIFLRLPKIGKYSNDNILPDILNSGDSEFKLFDYLRELTLRLCYFMEDLGENISNELYSRSPSDFKYELIALYGECIPNFVKFLNIKK